MYLTILTFEFVSSVEPHIFFFFFLPILSETVHLLFFSAPFMDCSVTGRTGIDMMEKLF
jgi:hypothetical protein